MKEFTSWLETQKFMEVKPFILEIYGERCAPCVAMAKNIETFVSKYPEIQAAKISVANVPAFFLENQGIRNVPFVLYHNGVTGFQSLGLQTVTQIEELFKKGAM